MVWCVEKLYCLLNDAITLCTCRCLMNQSGDLPHFGNTSKSMALADLFGRLSHSLIRSNAHAILSSSYAHLVQQLDELCV